MFKCVKNGFIKTIIHNNKKTMDIKFQQTNEKIKRIFPNAKFDIFLTENSLRGIVSFNKYIIVAWLGDICCGAQNDAEHYDPKIYTVHGESKEFITMEDVIRTLVDNNFEAPCQFRCFEGITPAVNVLDSSESVYFYSIEMSHIST